MVLYRSRIWFTQNVVAEDSPMVTIEGKPTDRMGPTMPFGLNNDQRNWILGFFCRLRTKAIKAPRICPSTVAHAAPAIPMLGKGPRPKISRGSKTRLKRAPLAWLNMARVGYPLQTRSFSNICPKKTPAETQTIIVR